MSEVILGIDLGTTFSIIAYVDDDGRPQLVENAEGKVLTPSVVLVENGQIAVGETAANQAILKRDKVVQWIKREMGDSDYRREGLSPVEISAAILRKLRNDSETFLQRPLTKAVITCPAYFSAPEIENTRKAGELAGYEVLRIVREPVAAAVYYGIDNLNDGQRILVYDLGGGTFDATILRLQEGTFHVLATLGDRQLGGHDWTTDLLEYVSRQLSEAFGQDPRDDPAVHQELYIRCETAKRDLSQLERVTISCMFQDKVSEFTIDRKTFECLTERRIQDSVSWCNHALAKANPPLTWAEIDKILLVGGSTRLRRVQEALAEASGKTPIRTSEVDTMVALGAAVIAKGTVRLRKPLIAAVSPSVTMGSRTQTGIVAVNVEDSCPRNLGTRVIVWDTTPPTSRTL